MNGSRLKGGNCALFTRPTVYNPSSVNPKKKRKTFNTMAQKRAEMEEERKKELEAQMQKPPEPPPFPPFRSYSSSCLLISQTLSSSTPVDRK
mmetsp:Transcript_34854/g.71222  ORF Transcript_34854/g.71222 Transcript_34854/m.71222 type:complete len:92 (+) Transcript_34854:532-807(+)